jgi:hypothetical protein
LDLPFFADNKSYVFYTSSEEEAHYLSAFLNSNQANEEMKPFQSTGLFGARDVHRKILDVPLPRFSAANGQHLALSGLGREAAAAVAAYVADSGVARTDYAVGKVRREIRQTVLAGLLPRIDAALAALLPAAPAPPDAAEASPARGLVFYDGGAFFVDDELESAEVGENIPDTGEQNPDFGENNPDSGE